MDSLLTLWAPLGLLFLSAIIGAVLRRRAIDPCLKIFRNSFVLIQLDNGKWLWGELHVYPNCLELRYLRPLKSEKGFFKKSYVLYDDKKTVIDHILRPSPAPGTAEQTAWDREVRHLQNPPFLRRCLRASRNIVNTLKDAFSQSITIVVGAVSQRTRMGAIKTMDKHADSTGKALLNTIPNAYEPVLESYIGSNIVVESLEGEGIKESFGLLQEYSEKFLLVRDIKLSDPLPEEARPPSGWPQRYDMIFPRTSALVRHQASQ